MCTTRVDLENANNMLVQSGEESSHTAYKYVPALFWGAFTQFLV